MGKKSRSDRSSVAVVHIRCKIEGDPAECFLELKRRGFISSAREAVVQGIICLHEKILERDLQIARVEASKRLSEEF